MPLGSFIDKDGNVITFPLDLNKASIFSSPMTLPVANETRSGIMDRLNIGSQPDDGKDYKWNGMLSIPRRLYAYDNAGEWKLGQEPYLAPERKGKTLYDDRKVFLKLETKILNNVNGRYLNIEVKFSAVEAIEKYKYGMEVACSSEESMKIDLSYGKLIINEKEISDFVLPDSCILKTIEISRIVTSLYIQNKRTKQ